jgi:hypothetical protein
MNEIIEEKQEEKDQINNDLTNPISISKRFFNRNLLDKKKRKPKPLVYDVFLYTKCDQVKDNDEQYGAWSSLIVQNSLEFNSSTKRDVDAQNSNKNMVFMLSGNEQNKHHVYIRLSSIKHTLEWIVQDIETSRYPFVEVVFTCNDIFLVNMLREWIPRWYNKKSANSNSNAKRPYKEVIDDIAKISTNIKLLVKWSCEDNFDLDCVKKKVEDEMAKIRSN